MGCAIHDERWEEVLKDPSKRLFDFDHVSVAIRKNAPLEVLDVLIPNDHSEINKLILEAACCNSQPALEWILANRPFDPTSLLNAIVYYVNVSVFYTDNGVPLEFADRVLSMKGIDIARRNGFGSAFIHKAIERNKYDLAMLIVKHHPLSATFSTPTYPCYCISIWNEALDLVKCLVENGHDPNARRLFTGQTMLHLSNDISVIQFLVEKAGANVFIKDNHGMRPSLSFRNKQCRQLLEFYENITCLQVFCSTITIVRIGRKSPIRTLPVEMFRELKKYIV
jgi:hypothetical protein